ncbi:heat-inducible transcriptional repressor HrcA [Picosynechococcus sp. PCC 8807]|uniref:heat-inducible transcriptional repressor HrcA n=1 Tax=Picosynechococcus sp. PCC 8807 TaxID=195248 RepID=UPI000810869F|nr:heat-inducible transcriptional repressor HrcA [Picosynechococcus sp. PCC 8807]ANV90989.1 heat-inducible transcriptional repressor HrcA [Picosynechococcus sp. PCC 8807]
MVAQKILNPRHQNIFRATVNHYISTAEPVGSKTLVEEYDFQVSSATIRNVMGKLEKAGFLYQPHISAGRVPSDSGYRLYVDELVTPNSQTRKRASQTLQEQTAAEYWGLDATLQRATQILATLSGYIALITVPHQNHTRLRYLQLLPLGDQKVMMIVVTDSYQPQSLSLILDCDPDELEILSNFLNHHLQGRSLQEIASLDPQALDEDFHHCQLLLETILGKIAQIVPNTIATPILVRGISEVLRQPEFSQIEQLQTLLHLLEAKQEQLLPVVFNGLPGDRPTLIHIGTENPLEPMKTCALISTYYYQEKTPVGSVAVLGPTRMFYENAIALVEATADYLSENLKAAF